MTGVAMERAAPHPRPRWGVAFREQLVVTGMAMRWDAAVLPALLAMTIWSANARALSLVALWRPEAAPDSSPPYLEMWTQIGFDVFGPGSVALLAAVALFLPAATWRGSDASRREYLSAMPLPAAAHALLKVAAGWAWMMAGVAAFALAMMATGAVVGSILAEVPVPVRVRGPGAWTWLVPFTGVTIAYLSGSALALTARHSSRYILLGTAGVIAVSAVLAEMGATMFAEHPIERVFEARLGLAAAVAGVTSVRRQFVAGTESLTTSSAVPDFDRWLPAMLLWLSLALGAVVLAAYRRRS